VVITIIGILAAMLFPLFGTIRQRANKASSASNLRQMGVALMAYASENGEVMPPDYANGTPPHTGQRWWPSYLSPYCGNNPKLFWRPGAPKDWAFLGHPYQTGNQWFMSAVDKSGAPTLWSGTWTADDQPIRWNYWVNNVSFCVPSSAQPQTRLADFTHPDSTVMVLDGFGWGGRDRWYLWPDGTVNVLWADGHVAPENADKITAYNLSKN